MTEKFENKPIDNKDDFFPQNTEPLSDEFFRNVNKSERAEGNIINIDGIEVGIRLFSLSGKDFISQFEPTDSLKKAAILSRSEKGHGYILPKIVNGKTVGNNSENYFVYSYIVPLSDWQRKGRSYKENELPDNEDEEILESTPYIIDVDKFNNDNKSPADLENITRIKEEAE